MDFSWTDEQQTLREAAVCFTKRELNEALVERDRNRTLSLENWQK